MRESALALTVLLIALPHGALAQQPNPLPALQDERLRLQREWAYDVDGASEFTRAQVLRAFLSKPPADTVPKLGPGSQQARLQEYAVARDRQRREKAAARARLFWGIDFTQPASRK